MSYSSNRPLRRVALIGRRIIQFFTGHRLGAWVAGSYALPQRGFFPHPNAKRDYRLHLPGGYAAGKTWPLVVMLHGCKQDAFAFAAGTRMNAIADREGFLVLYPEQKRLANAFRCWNWFDAAAQRAEGESALIAGMIREISASYAVDPRRVYIAGISAGGAMACVMAHSYGQLFAACAVHSGLMYRAAESGSQALRVMRHGSSASPQHTVRANAGFVPALVIHGSADDTVHPVNAEQLVEQFVAMSAGTARGALRLVTSQHNATAGNGHGYAMGDYYGGDQLLVRKIMVNGLGHAWSGGDDELAFNDSKGPDASRMIWEFFTAFERSIERRPAAEAG
jgi:poly(hydroxyalkanoate) depolymerase family esterase